MTYILIGIACTLLGYLLSQLQHKRKIRSANQQFDLAVDMFNEAEKLRR